MNIFLIIFIILITNEFTQSEGLNLIQIDPPQILGLFEQSNGYQNLLTENPDISLITETQITAYFEEQCAIACIRNLQCARYAYNQMKNLCQLSLQLTRQHRQIKFANLEKGKEISKDLNCDLSDCSKGIYCSGSITETGACLCKPGDSSQDCSGKVNYQYKLNQWSEWSKCTANCKNNQGNIRALSYSKNRISPTLTFDLIS